VLMRFSEQMNIELTYDMQGMNNETKTYQTFTLLAETKRLANATTLRYTFHTHFNRTQHDAVLYAVAMQNERRNATEGVLRAMVCASKRSRNNQEKQ